VPHPSIENDLVQAGYITSCQLQSAHAFLRGWGGRLAIEDALVKLGLVSRSQVALLVKLAEARGGGHVDRVAVNEPSGARGHEREDGNAAVAAARGVG
jgi:hypothetical protein